MTYQCIFRKSKRAKRLRITIKASKEIIVTVPRLVPMFIAKKFVQSKQNWIEQKLKQNNKKPSLLQQLEKRGNYLKDKAEATRVIVARVEFYARKYGFNYHKISIKNQKTLWGSCSSKGNLNFNYKLLWLSEEQRDYIIVHELCHLRQMNHSARFWREVEKILPNYKTIKRSFNSNSLG